MPGLLDVRWVEPFHAEDLVRSEVPLLRAALLGVFVDPRLDKCVGARQILLGEAEAFGEVALPSLNPALQHEHNPMREETA